MIIWVIMLTKIIQITLIILGALSISVIFGCIVGRFLSMSHEPEGDNDITKTICQ